MLKIITAPNSILSQEAKKITKIDKTIKHLIDQMTETLVNASDPEGVGLAAPQVGQSLRLFIVKEDAKSQLLTCINPTLTIPNPRLLIQTAQDFHDEEKKEKEVKLEGCLSLRDIWGTVKRYDKVVLSYQDRDGKKHKETFTGFLATIIQHECDHLQGILFPKRVLEQKGHLYKAVKNEKGETVFEELRI